MEPAPASRLLATLLSPISGSEIVMPEKLSEQYLAHAAQEREYAATSALANVIAIHLRSAAKWDQLALQAARLESGR